MLKPECFKVVLDDEYGYRRLDPVPTEAELNEFYRENYYELIEAGGRAPELNRYLQGGDIAEAEMTWLAKGLWTDVHDTLLQHLPEEKPGTILDFGCGPGHFGRFLRDCGWDMTGVEPATSVAKQAREAGLSVYASLAKLVAAKDAGFDAIVSLNVFEHIPNPAKTMKELVGLCKPGGIIATRVPNDFTEIQASALEKLGCKPWWVAIPDHVNYFELNSLKRFCESFGLEVVDSFTDFPMELFLLFGENYIGDTKVGSECHQKRVSFDLSVAPPLRRQIYRSFAASGLGRNCVVFARRP